MRKFVSLCRDKKCIFMPVFACISIVQLYGVFWLGQKFSQSNMLLSLYLHQMGLGIQKLY